MYIGKIRKCIWLVIKARPILSKTKEFSRSYAVTFTSKVVISQKGHKIEKCVSLVFVGATLWHRTGYTLGFAMHFLFCVNLAHSTKLLTGLYILPSVICFFFSSLGKLDEGLSILLALISPFFTIIIIFIHR